ncbi:MAG: DUF2292 domain-containing protein [Kurthia sp.]|nr:DUF2292 domain-containing protein [Candidatus Kurthia equi]
MEQKESLKILREKLNEFVPRIQDGSIRIIVQDSRVIQIEKSEEIPIKK